MAAAAETAQKFIEITQDGAGRLLFKKGKSQGLCTTGIDTCIVIIVIGAKGISLIHDTGLLDVEQMKREWGLVSVNGKVAVHIIYNATTFERQRPISIAELRARGIPIQDKIDRVQEALRSCFGVKAVLRGTEDSTTGMMYRHVGGEVTYKFLNGTDIASFTLVEPSDRGKRCRINDLNNLFQINNEATLPIDLQYDGEQLLPCGVFIKPIKEMERIARKKQEEGDHDYSNQLTAFNLLYGGTLDDVSGEETGTFSGFTPGFLSSSTGSHISTTRAQSDHRSTAATATDAKIGDFGGFKRGFLL